MDDRVFAAFFNKICSVVECLEPFNPTTFDIYRSWFGPRGSFVLSEDGIARRRDLIRKALSHSDWGQKFSAEYLGKRFGDIIEICAQEGSNRAVEEFRVLVKSLDDYIAQHTVFLPLFGLDIPDAQSRSLGGITLHRSDAAFMDRLTSERLPANLH